MFISLDDHSTLRGLEEKYGCALLLDAMLSHQRARFASAGGAVRHWSVNRLVAAKAAYMCEPLPESIQEDLPPHLLK